MKFAGRAFGLFVLFLSVTYLFLFLYYFHRDNNIFARNFSSLIQFDLSLTIYLTVGFGSIVFSAFRGVNRNLLIGFLVFSTAFFFAYGVFLPFLAGLTRILAIYTLGALLKSGLVTVGLFPARTGVLVTALLGAVATLVVAGLLSILHAYSPSVLLGLDGVILLAGLWVFRIPIEAYFLQPSRCAETVSAPALFAGALIVGTSYLRSNSMIDHDSAWYGLGWINGVVDRSVFESIGMVAPVHYYPKGQEMLAGWLGAFGDFSYQIGFSGWLYALGAYFLISRAAAAKRNAHWLPVFLLALVLTPAGMALASTAKPDTLGLVSALVATYCLGSYFVKQDDVRSAAVVVPLCALAAVAKFQFLVLCAPIFLLALAALAIRSKTVEVVRIYWPLLVLSGVAVLVVILRTYAQTGFFLVGPESIIDLQAALGLRPSNEFSAVAMSTFGAAPPAGFGGMVGLLFPGGTTALWYTWSGPFLVLLPILWVGRWAFFGQPNFWLFGLSLTYFAGGVFLAIGVPYTNYLGDGNYYFGAFAMSAIFFVVDACRQNGPHDNLLIAMLSAMFAGLALLLVFTATYQRGAGIPSWWPSWDSERPSVETRIVEATQLWGVQRAVRGGENCHALAFPASNAPRRALYTLPCRVEDLGNFSWNREASTALRDDPDYLYHFICANRVTYVIVEDGFDTALIPGLAGGRLDRYRVDLERGSERWELYETGHPQLCRERPAS